MTSTTVARIRARRAIRPTAKRVPKQAHPHNIEREYARTLKGMMTAINAEVQQEVKKLFAPAHHDADRKLPELKPSAVSVPHGLEGIKLEMERKFTSTRVGLVAQGAGDRTNKFNRVAVGDQIKAVIGVDPLSNVEHVSTIKPILEKFTQENVKLIQSIPERYFSEVGGIVQDAIHTGKRADEVSALVQARYDVSQARADLIARDQISKLNGKLTEARQESLGINGYFWRTNLDERVRETHAALEGKRFDWNNPPQVGHPGQDFQCRCRPEPDLSGLLGSL